MTEAILDDATPEPGATDAANADSGRPAELPEKFWDPETESVRADALAKSYVELERKLGGLAGRGVPDDPTGYSITAPNDILASDADVNDRLHAAGFTQEQAQLVYDLAGERLLPALSELAAEFEAQKQIDRLVDHFGGEQRWRETSRQIEAWGRAHLPAEVVEAMSTTYEGVLALHRMMGNGEPALARGADAGGASPSESDLRRLMSDPSYWRDQDPQAVARVREGFRQLYPGEG